MAEQAVSVAGEAAQERPTGPPVVFLLLGLTAALASVMLLFIEGFGANVTGYVLATVVPVMSVGLFRHFDLARRINPAYVTRPIAGRLIPLVLVLGLVAAVLHTWAIATEVAS